MIDRDLLRTTVEKAIEGTDVFLVDLRIEPQNRIVVEIDSPTGIDIDTCAKMTKKIEAAFDREKEDYELEVGSAGLTSPFKVKQQYIKNLGKEVEVVTKDGRKLKGLLSAVNAGDFVIEIPTKVKAEGEKRPKLVNVPTTINFDETKTVKHILNFK